MRKYFFFPIFFFFIFSNAQSNKNVENGLFRINVIAPGASYELGVGKNTTLNFEVSLIPMSRVEFGNEVDFELFPVIGAEFRYFTNFNRRIEKGKNISGNSGNYISFLNQAFLTVPILGNIEYDTPVAYLGTFAYGFQRTYKKGFYFGIAGGPGLFVGDNYPTATLYLDARLGWVIGRRK